MNSYYPHIARRDSLLVRFLCHPAVSRFGRYFYRIEHCRVQNDCSTFVRIDWL